jgi:hypothetical protein
MVQGCGGERNKASGERHCKETGGPKSLRYKGGMNEATMSAATGWRSSIPAGVRPYTERAPLAALFLGMSSGFPSR